MSYFAATEPQCAGDSGGVKLTITPRERDLGDFAVRRVLPARERRMVGPFIFFDHMGPAELPPGKGIQVRPHPHVCLATVTYLFEGEIMHRDSLGFVQPILPGAVNLMTAGRGIVHSERAGGDLDETSRLHGIQSWIALPDGSEEIDPAFVHHPARDIPEFERDGVAVRLIMGEVWGRRSPVTTYSPTLYLECRMPASTSINLPQECKELAVYAVSGAIEIERCAYRAGAMLVLTAGGAAVTARGDTHLMVIGGDPIGRRHIWWNFVASSKERIERAKADWREGRFAMVPGDDEFIPLPD